MAWSYWHVTYSCCHKDSCLLLSLPGAKWSDYKCFSHSSAVIAVSDYHSHYETKLFACDRFTHFIENCIEWKWKIYITEYINLVLLNFWLKYIQYHFIWWIYRNMGPIQAPKATIASLKALLIPVNTSFQQYKAPILFMTIHLHKTWMLLILAWYYTYHSTIL